MKDNYIICIYNHSIVKVLFDDAMSGYYPRYDTIEVIAPFMKEDNGYGVLIMDNEIIPVIDSWDGFQPLYNNDGSGYDYSNNIVYEFLKEALWV